MTCCRKCCLPKGIRDICVVVYVVLFSQVANHTSEENSTLEFVLRNVLTEVFANFKQEDQGYKLLANRIEGLEMALQGDKNKTRSNLPDNEQRYSTVLINALKNGKPIDKIQKVCFWPVSVA